MENETVSVDTVNKKERRKSRKSVHDVNQALGIVSDYFVNFISYDKMK